MATFDKTLAVTVCPLCGLVKEGEIVLEDMNGETGSKFLCGTIILPFQKLIKSTGDKCRIVQKLRAPKAPDALSLFSGLA